MTNRNKLAPIIEEDQSEISIDHSMYETHGLEFDAASDFEFMTEADAESSYPDGKLECIEEEERGSDGRGSFEESKSGNG